MTPTICLSMIVRDEAEVVRETLDSVAPHIDYWVIVDTGSTDATIEVIRSHMAETGVPGEIVERPWRDFGHNRTEALEACQGRTDYIWVIDADDLIVGELDLAQLRADSYLLRYGDEFRYWRKQIFRDGLRWRYKGAVHEYPVCLDPASEARLAGDYYIDSRRLGARSRSSDKYERDCRLLREAVERESDDLARSIFYLAQSYYDAGDHALALEWYTRRAQMGGWDEEVFYSLLRRAACIERLEEPWDRALAAYLDAWQARPTRAEPLYEIAHHYGSEGRFNLAYMFAKRAAETPYPEDDSLFITADVYRWRARDQLAISAYYVGRYEESFGVSSALLDGASLPEGERARVEQNRAFCVPQLQEQRSEYPAELVSRLTDRLGERARDAAEVTLTITGCRRPVLFERTVNSFLNCCTDVERIDRWICVDNGSGEADRKRMRELYPMFEFIYTDAALEGHADSLNRLREQVTSPLWLHLEDDWQFFWRGPYVERALGILDDDRAIAQVAFNRNYEEVLEQPVLGGRVSRTSRDGLRYRIHEYLPIDSPQWREHLDSLPAGGCTNAYWPHFTLRPSLMRTEAIKRLGPFRPGGHFELEFANRYAAAALRTAFFDAINCLHIGRLTTQGPDDERTSAYELVGDGKHPAHPDQIEMPDPELSISVINLDRRPDRWESFRARMIAAAGEVFAGRCERFAAIDGSQLLLVPEIDRLFRDNDFALRRGIVGCALSHISIWRSVAARDDGALELVLEDDARPCDRFENRLKAVLQELRGAHGDFDLVFLGCSRIPQTPEALGETLLRPMRWEGCIGGLFAYVISGQGARKLLELVERDGVQNGIDRFIKLKRTELRALECAPPLAEAPLAFAGDGVDSDIQHDFAAIADGPVPDAAARSGTARASLASLVPELELGRLQLDVEPPWPCSGASIAATEDGFRAVVRTVGQTNEGPALNYLLSLDDAFELQSVEFLAPVDPDDRWYDGCRLVRAGERWFASALECSATTAPRPVLLRLDGARIAEVEPFSACDAECVAPPLPFAAGGALKLISSWSPLRVLGSGNQSWAGPAPAIASVLAAGSSGVSLDAGWLFAVDDRAAMAHRLVLLDRGYGLTAVTPPLSIAGQDGESCWGLARRDRQLAISFGIDHEAAGLAVLPLERALGLLEPCQ